jgi:murein DD-endopeptidase MepM/ murein hydrolase activator NlpD
LNASLRRLAVSRVPAAAAGVLAALVLAVTVVGGAAPPQVSWLHRNSTSTVVGGGEYGCADGDPGATRSAVYGTSGWDEAQIDNATVVYLVAAERGLGDQGAFIGLIAAYEESRLYNYANFDVDESLEYDHDKIGHDDDGVGIFQQRPNSGWGSVEDLMDPEYAAGEFYDRLVAVDGWESMAPTEAARAVQVSSSPDAYPRWEAYAEAAVGHFTDHIRCVPVGDEWVWTRPVADGDFWGGFRTADRPGHDGVDIGAADAGKGDEILAASAGVVARVRCDAQLGEEDYSCDVDGSAEVSGCGWYVDVEHPDNAVTRYCHMMSQPLVAVGDVVLPGEVIGYLGSSGNSGAPHLHFETHVGTAPATSENAVSPVEFMAERGVSIE